MCAMVAHDGGMKHTAYKHKWDRKVAKQKSREDSEKDSVGGMQVLALIPLVVRRTTAQGEAIHSRPPDGFTATAARRIEQEVTSFAEQMR